MYIHDFEEYEIYLITYKLLLEPIIDYMRYKCSHYHRSARSDKCYPKRLEESRKHGSKNLRLSNVSISPT